MSETDELSSEQIVMLAAVLGGQSEVWVTAPDSPNDDLLKKWQRLGWFEEDRETQWWPVLAAYRITTKGREALAAYKPMEPVEMMTFRGS